MVSAKECDSNKDCKDFKLPYCNTTTNKCVKKEGENEETFSEYEGEAGEYSEYEGEAQGNVSQTEDLEPASETGGVLVESGRKEGEPEKDEPRREGEGAPGVPPKDVSKDSAKPDSVLSGAAGPKKARKRLSRKARRLAWLAREKALPWLNRHQLWTQKLGLPVLTNKQVCIYGSLSVAALVVFILALVGLVACCRKRRKQHDSEFVVMSSPVYGTAAVSRSRF